MCKRAARLTPHQQWVQQSPQGDGPSWWAALRRPRGPAARQHWQPSSDSTQYRQQLPKHEPSPSFSVFSPYRHGRQKVPQQQVPQSEKHPCTEECICCWGDAGMADAQTHSPTDSSAEAAAAEGDALATNTVRPMSSTLGHDTMRVIAAGQAGFRRGESHQQAVCPKKKIPAAPPAVCVVCVGPAALTQIPVGQADIAGALHALETPRAEEEGRTARKWCGTGCVRA